LEQTRVSPLMPAKAGIQNRASALGPRLHGDERNSGSGCNPHPCELPLRQFLHGVAHTLAAEARRADAAKGIHVEAEAAGVIDPERADTKLPRDLERGLEALGE